MELAFKRDFCLGRAFWCFGLRKIETFLSLFLFRQSLMWARTFKQHWNCFVFFFPLQESTGWGQFLQMEVELENQPYNLGNWHSKKNPQNLDRVSLVEGEGILGRGNSKGCQYSLDTGTEDPFLLQTEPKEPIQTLPREMISLATGWKLGPSFLRKTSQEKLSSAGIHWVAHLSSESFPQ